MGNGDAPLEVQLREINPADDIQRSSVQNSILCFLDVDNLSITLSSKETVLCNVVIVNESMEEMSAYPCVISGSPTVIPLNSAGEYNISISLTNGACYYGEFSK